MRLKHVPEDAWDLLSSQLTETRKRRMIETAARRTKHVRLVVQDVHQPHNVSACIRSAEGFGIQNIDVVTLKSKFNASTVARGVDHWVDITRHTDVHECVRHLKDQGYVIAAAFPHGDAVALEQLPVDKPIALVFGNEHDGLDSEWRRQADVCFTIPMVGIVESLNISVCAAVSMYSVTQRAKGVLGPSRYCIGETSQKELLNRWICRQITSWEPQLERLRSKI